MMAAGRRCGRALLAPLAYFLLVHTPLLDRRPQTWDSLLPLAWDWAVRGQKL